MIFLLFPIVTITAIPVPKALCERPPAIHGANSDNKKNEAPKPLFTIRGFTANQPFKNPSAVFFDRYDSLLYVADADWGEVGVFTGDGFLLKKFGEHNDLAEPVGIAVDGKGIMYVSDRVAAGVSALDMMGNEILEYDLKSVEGDYPVHPGKIALDGAHRLYLVDQNNRRVVVFGGNGKYERSLPSGAAPGPPLENPADIEVTEDGRVFVVDSIGAPLKTFDAQGRLTPALPKRVEDGENFKFATAVEMDALGRTWLVDSFRHKVSVYDKNLEFIFSFGGLGSGDGRFFFPADIALDEKGGRVFVLEKDGRRVQVFGYDFSIRE